MKRLWFSLQLKKLWYMYQPLNFRTEICRTCKNLFSKIKQFVEIFWLREQNKRNISNWTTMSENFLRKCATSEDSDQPAHSRSLIRIFTGRILDSKVSSWGQRRLWSGCVDARELAQNFWSYPCTTFPRWECGYVNFEQINNLYLLLYS